MTLNTTAANRLSDLELEVTRTFNGPVSALYEAWTKPDLFRKWWVPKDFEVPLLVCEMDVRTNGAYRLVYGHSMDQSFPFVGKYIDVVPLERIVWTNEESEDGGVTTVTFLSINGKTQVTYHERYPTKEACDEALQGSALGLKTQFEQLADMLAAD